MPNSEQHSRFADQQLEEFRMEFKEHVKEYAERMVRYDEQFDKIINSQATNAEDLSDLIRETRGIVELHRDLQGATRLGMSAQNFAIWVAKWGTIGAGASFLLKWAFDHLQKLFN